ncbi:MAG: exosortase/archaeosortase family protein [Planctomycetota bacterium]
MIMTTVSVSQTDASPSPTAGSGGWSARQYALTALLAGVGIIATFDVWSDLAWRGTQDEEASHILLVPIIVIWLAFLRRKRAATAVVRGQWVGVAITALGWLCYTIGDAFLMLSLWQLSAVVVLVGTIVTGLGTDVLKRFAPAIMVMIFLVPLPAIARQNITLPMQQSAAVVTQLILDVIGTGVERQGNLLTINGTPVTVAEACNGLRMSHALVLVSVAFAFATPMRTWVRLAVLALSPVFAVACNILRLVPTVWAYGYMEPESADLFHDMAGWVMLLVGYLVLTGFVWSLEWLGLPVMLPKARAFATAALGTVGRPSVVAVAASSVVLLALIAERVYWQIEPGDATAYQAGIAEAAEALPFQTGSWFGQTMPVPTQATELLKPTALVSRRYSNLSGTAAVGLLMVHVQDNRDLLGHFPPVCYPNQAWTMLSQEPVVWEVDDMTIDGVRYRFHPPGSREDHPPVTILNFITVPGGDRTLRDMNELEDAVKDRSRLHYGAGQMQLLFYAGEDEARQAEVLAEFIRLGRPMIEAMMAEPTLVE